MTTCFQPPNSGILFDEHVPTLTGLDGDMWASQLLTINTMESLTNVIFDFTDTPHYDRVERVEVVMFNGPQWGIASTLIVLTGATVRGQPFSTFASISVSSLTSCESLVRVCLSAFISQPLIGLQFILDQDSDWVHLADMIFNARNSICPPNVILTSSPTSPPPDTPPTITPPDANITTILPTSTTNISSDPTTTTSQGTSNPTTTIIAAVVPLSIVLIIVIIIVVLIFCIVCTTKHKHLLRAKVDHTTIHRQTHNHQPLGHINLCEETGQAYYSSLHDIQREDVPADQVYNRLERHTGPVRGGAKSPRGATVDQNEAEVRACSTVSYSKQPQASKEAGVEGMEDPLSQLYAKVDEDIKKKKTEDVFATDQQEEAALYAQVDEKRKKNKKKKEEDTPPYKPDQLYAQVDKKKRKKKEKEEIEEVSPQESGDMYSVVNKPSAPPIPLKSDLLMEELQ